MRDFFPTRTSGPASCNDGFGRPIRTPFSPVRSSLAQIQQFCPGATFVDDVPARAATHPIIRLDGRPADESPGGKLHSDLVKRRRHGVRQRPARPVGRREVAAIPDAHEQAVAESKADSDVGRGDRMALPRQPVVRDVGHRLGRRPEGSRECDEATIAVFDTPSTYLITGAFTSRKSQFVYATPPFHPLESRK